MRLDQTYIRIRERNVLELVDLTFVLIRRRFWVLVAWMLLGTFPWMLLNMFLLAPLAWSKADYNSSPAGQVFQHCILVFIQAPFASLFVSSFLGKAVFERRPSFRTVFQSVFSELGRVIGVLGFLRLNFIALGIMLLMIWSEAFLMDYEEWFGAAFFACLMAFVLWVIRSIYPFTPEVVLLEKPRGVAANGTGIFRQRLKQLHRFSGSELFTRAIVVTLFSVLMFFSMYGGFWLLWSYFYNEGYPGVGTNVIGLQLSAWGIVLFNAVFRFASYLDIRIRQEGWEIELLMKAEARALEDASQLSRTGRGATQ